MQDINTLHIALVQTQILWEDKGANYRKAEALLQRAADGGAEAVFFPEMSFTGFSMDTEATRERARETVVFASALARRCHIHVGFGWVEDCGGKCENHYTVVDDEGRMLSDYVKIHPFSYSGEDVRFQGGAAITAFRIKDIGFSCFICYDLRFPEIFQQAAERAHMILVPANWPAKRGGHWKALLRARAIENQVYILAVNCVGDIGGTWYAGDSCVIDPNGDVRASISGQEGLLFCTVADDAERFRESFPVRRDRREELYWKLWQERRQKGEEH